MRNRKTLKKSMAVMLAAVMAVTSVGTIPAKAQETAASTHYEGNGYKVDFSITGSWQGAYNAEITVTNTTDKVIDNWALGFTMSDKITQIWNGVIKKEEEGSYIIKNDGTNQDIEGGGSITFGFTAEDEDGVKDMPEKYDMLCRKITVEKSRTETEYKVTNSWETGYEAQISITNESDTTIEDWEISFDYKDRIENLWDAEIVSCKDGRNVIKNNTHNQNIKAGETVTFGYTSDCAYNGQEPGNIEITEITTKDSTGENGTGEDKYVTLKDGKIDKEYLYTAIYPRLVLRGMKTEDIRLADDYDGDGLTLKQEYEYDTDPFQEDTDEDGLGDYEEINIYGTDPLKKDSDKDGMSDGTEISCGLNPNKKDTDGDGTKDAEETTLQNVRLNGYEEIKNNQVVPQVTLKGSGDYSLKLNAVNDRESYLLQKGYVVGEVYDFQHDEEIEFEEGSLSFNISDGLLKENNLVDLKIAYYNEETGALEILDTAYDKKEGTVTASVSHFSRYMVINYKSFLYNSNVLGNGTETDIKPYESQKDNIGTYKGHKYQLLNVGGSWQEAYDYCTSRGGHLVTIGESGEQEFLNSLMETYGTKNTYHIGLSGDDNMYSWVDGEPLSYENWDTGEPNNTWETVVHMYGTDYEGHARGSWNDTNNYTSGDRFHASANAGFICEWESEEAYEKNKDRTQEGCWITLSDGSYIRLDKNPELNDESVDTDGDGIPDIYELKEKAERTFHNPYTGEEEIVSVWEFYSNPAEKDTDGDGIEDYDDFNSRHYDETVTEKTDSCVKFNTGRVWKKTDFRVDEYVKEVYNTRHTDRFLPYLNAVKSNSQYEFSMNELVYLSIYDPEGMTVYMDTSTDQEREELFKELTGRKSKYYRHEGMFDSSDWKEVDSKEEGGFFKGEVLSEAEINFSLKIYNVCDIYKLAETATSMAMIVITAIFVVEVTEVVLVNVVSLEAYIEIYGIRGGIEMYRLLGTSNVENGIVGALQAEREAESGSSYASPDKVSSLLHGKSELTGSTRDKLLATVQNIELKKIVNELYRPGAIIGDGGTAAMLVKEFSNGLSTHLIKATERLAQLRNLASSGKLGLNDLDVVEALIEDLEYAIGLFD